MAAPPACNLSSAISSSTLIAAGLGAVQALILLQAAAPGKQGCEGCPSDCTVPCRAMLCCVLLAPPPQALILLGSSTWAARLWGVSPSSPLWEAAAEFLSIRALGAPVTVLLLVMQGVHRGLADTRTPFYATLASNGLNVVLGYGLIFTAGLGTRSCAS